MMEKSRIYLIGRRIDTVLGEKGWKPADLARASGVAEPQISQYRSGKHEPSSRVCAALAEALGVSASWLIGKTDERNDPNQKLVGQIEGLILAASRKHPDKSNLSEKTLKQIQKMLEMFLEEDEPNP